MSEIQEPEPVDPRCEIEGVPLCTGCGRPYKRDQYYCAHCGAGVGNRTPYVPYVNIRFNYAPLGGAIKNVWQGKENRWLAVVGAILVFCGLFSFYVLAAPFLVVEWLRNRKKIPPETAKGKGDADAALDAAPSDESHADGGLV